MVPNYVQKCVQIFTYADKKKTAFTTMKQLYSIFMKVFSSKIIYILLLPPFHVCLGDESDVT